MYPNSTAYMQPTYPQIQNPYYPYYSYRPNLYNSQQPPVNSQQAPATPDMVPPISEGLIGRVVDTSEEIMPNEIRMDGSIGLFPMRDLSSIYVKQWDQNANLQTIRYVPEVVPESKLNNDNFNNQDQLNTLSQILDQLNDIQDLLTRPEANSGATKKESKDKKAMEVIDV